MENKEACLIGADSQCVNGKIKGLPCCGRPRVREWENKKAYLIGADPQCVEWYAR